MISDTDKAIQELARFLLPAERTGNLPVSVIQGVIHKLSDDRLELFLPRESGHAGASPIEGSSNLFPVTGVRYLDSYTPYAGDVVYCLRIGTDTICLGSLHTRVKPDTAWHEVGAAGEPAFSNSWVNYGAGYNTAAFRKQADGFVRFKGLVKNGSSAGSTIFVLPPGYRPMEEMYYHVLSNGAAAMLVCRPAGAVQCFLNSNTAFVSLDRVVFPTNWRKPDWTLPIYQTTTVTDLGAPQGDARFFTREDGVTFMQGAVQPTVNAPVGLLLLPERARRHRGLEMLQGVGAGVINRLAVGGSQPGHLSLDTGAASTTVYISGTYYSDVGSHLDSEWKAFPFATGWGNFGSGWTDCAYRKDVYGAVWLGGLALGTGAGTGLIGTLPPGYRPSATHIFSQMGGPANQQRRIDVASNGTVTELSGLTNSFLNLNGVHFYADQ